LSGVAGERVAGGKQSPISTSSSAAVVTLERCFNSDRKTWPSGCARIAVAIYRSGSLICAFQGPDRRD
jgi:hypothetical protein